MAGRSKDADYQPPVVDIPRMPKPLTMEEKEYFLAVERGDLKTTRKILIRSRLDSSAIDVNCVDSLGRSTLLLAIENENLEMIRALVRGGVRTRDSLLHAIDQEFVEGVEFLLTHETENHREGQPHSWETVSAQTASFTPEVTPLMLAAHRDNYEIIKLLLDAGAALPAAHDVRCPCTECVTSASEDSLRHARRRFNAYRALASPSLVALSSTDPILTAFELCWELKNLSAIENEYKENYLELRTRCQDFAVNLLAQARSSSELEVLLNYDPLQVTTGDAVNRVPLARLRVAIERNQKKFVAHPNVQQLLSALWYKGLPGFRRKNLPMQLLTVVTIVALFPFYAMVYMLAPTSPTGKLMRKPFMKFLIHSASYLFFLFLLILASQRIEDVIAELLASSASANAGYDVRSHQAAATTKRGNPPTIVEWVIFAYVMGFVWQESRQLCSEGLRSYSANMWNAIDFLRNVLYLSTIGLRFLAYVQARRERANNSASAFIPRENWGAFDPMLIAESLFAAANIFSALKLLHMFSINPYLGPLQISLGRMVIDIVKFFFIYTLVLFSFACGLNQLLWYYSDLERQKCYSLPGGGADWKSNSDSCMIWRRFINLFESSQSLFWASFGMIDLRNFELSGIQSFTRFAAMLMFGSYSVINVIVLLNLLIAMMSTSYNMISDRSDIEWKFARTKLWLTYFDNSATLPPPFNIIPTPKHIMNLLGCCNTKNKTNAGDKTQNHHYQYQAIVQSLVWRYVTKQQRKSEYAAVTEDHINEVKQDISAFRFELMDVLNQNGMEIKRQASTNRRQTATVNVTLAQVGGGGGGGKKARVWERRLLNDFTVAPVESCSMEATPEGAEETLTKFRRLVRIAADGIGGGVDGSRGRTIRRWRDLATAARQQSQATVLASETIHEEPGEEPPPTLVGEVGKDEELKSVKVTQPESTTAVIEYEGERYSPPPPLSPPPPDDGGEKWSNDSTDFPSPLPSPPSVRQDSLSSVASDRPSFSNDAFQLSCELISGPKQSSTAPDTSPEHQLDRKLSVEDSAVMANRMEQESTDDLCPLIPSKDHGRRNEEINVNEPPSRSLPTPPTLREDSTPNTTGVQQLKTVKRPLGGAWL